MADKSEIKKQKVNKKFEKLSKHQDGMQAMIRKQKVKTYKNTEIKIKQEGWSIV